MRKTTADDTETKQAMLKALAAYRGPVTQCPDGEARAEPLRMVDDAGRWLKQHRHNRRHIDPVARRRRDRTARARQQRILRRNAAIRAQREAP
jgi:hypothetical protein